MFPDEKKAVRDGDVLAHRWVVSDPSLKADERDVPFISHTGVVVIQRRGSDTARVWYRNTYASAAVDVDGVAAVWSLTSLRRPELDVDLVLLDGDPVTASGELARTVPHHGDADLVVWAPFQLIDALRYPWADALRTSSLPHTVA